MGKRILAGLLSVLLTVALLPKTARAAVETEWNLSKNGNLIIADANHNPDGYIIKGGAGTINTIVVSTTKPVKITLDGVDIDVNNCALSINQGADVILTLADGSMNKLLSGGSSAGVHVPAGASLTIQGGGTVIAKSGGTGAGIGGNEGGDGGAITINSGTVSATGGADNVSGGAGIGGGGAGTGGRGGSGGTITINGGTVSAIGRGNGAGIGGGGVDNGGQGGSGGTITINGGTVSAIGGGLSAGIGGGGASQLGVGNATGTGGDAGDIKINGGTVSAQNGYSSSFGADAYGAAIGGGAGARGSNSSVRTAPGSVDLSRYAQYEWAHTNADTQPTAFMPAPYPDGQYPNGLQNAPGWTVIRPGADVPKTGDNAPLALLFGLIALCSAGLFIRTGKRKCG